MAQAGSIITVTKGGMNVTYDSEANAAYINLLDGCSATQIHSIPTPGGLGEITLDFDEAGQLLGIEILNASEVLPPGVVESASRP